MSSDKKIESITIPYNKVPNESLQSELRHAMEVQFRHKLYNEVQFPYLQSLGIRNILQGFGNEEVGFIGILHLWWVNEDNNIIYDNVRRSLVKIKGIWKSNWLNHPQEAIILVQKLEDGRPYVEEKLVQIQQDYINQIAEKRAEMEVMKQIHEKQKEEEEETEKIPKKILWN